MPEIATVTSKGQVTLPASIRRRLGLKKGSKVLFLETERGIRLITERELERQFALFDDMREDAQLTPERVRDLVKEAKDRLWREHYAGRG